MNTLEHAAGFSSTDSSQSVAANAVIGSETQRPAVSIDNFGA